MTAALLDKRIRLHPDVVVSRPLLRGTGEVGLVKDLRTGRAYEVAPKEHFLLAHLDGRRTLGEIGEEYARAFGRRLGEVNWTQLLQLLYGRSLLDVPEPGDHPEPAQPPPMLAFVDACHRRVRRALAPPVLLALAGLVLATLVLLAVHAAELGRGVWWLLQHSPWLVAVLLLTGFSAALHELAHGVLARHYGARVTRVSLVTLHCHVDDYPYLRSRAHQVAIAGAGTLVNGLVLVPLTVAWLALAPGTAPRAALAGMLLVGALQTVVNLVPLPPLDGYRALGHALNTARLATDSRQFLRLALARAVGGGPGIGGYSRRARIVYGTYGLVASALIGAAVAGVVLLGRWLAVDSLGSSVVLIAVVAASMTLAGWLARPDRPRTTREPQEGGTR